MPMKIGFKVVFVLVHWVSILLSLVFRSPVMMIPESSCRSVNSASFIQNCFRSSVSVSGGMYTCITMSSWLIVMACACMFSVCSRCMVELCSVVTVLSFRQNIPLCWPKSDVM